MKTLEIVFLISILLTTSVYAVGIGEEVDYPSQCDSGYARFVKKTVLNESILICTTNDDITAWSRSLDEMQNSTEVISAKSISDSAIAVQMDLAEANTVWTNANELYWQYKNDGFPEEGILGIRDYNVTIWRYIWAFFILFLELIKLIYYIIEILLVIYIIFTLIPESFFRLRDSIVKTYIRRQST